MNYLDENALEFLNQFLLDFGCYALPDFRGGHGHPSYSFTSAKNSWTATIVSVERNPESPKPDKLVQRDGK